MNGLLDFCAALLLLTGGFIVMALIVIFIGLVAIEISDNMREQKRGSEEEE